jgi:very-short-patch-repair endonuclease
MSPPQHVGRRPSRPLPNGTEQGIRSNANLSFMHELSAFVCSRGHLAATRDLTRAGFPRERLTEAITRRELWRPRRGTYACLHIDVELAFVAGVGGALTCVSALKRLGVWSGFDIRLHLQLAATHGRMPLTIDPHGRLPRVHWHNPEFGMTTRWLVSPREALWQALHCLDHENALAALESAAHGGVLGSAEVAHLAGLAPKRLIDDLPDLNFGSGSGYESIVRFRLIKHGFQVQSQAHVPGLGHQDLLVEDIVGLEVDGKSFHDTEDQFALDRDRDLHAAALGRTTLRLRPAHVTRDWELVLAAIERLVADGRRASEYRTYRA